MSRFGEIRDRAVQEFGSDRDKRRISDLAVDYAEQWAELTGFGDPSELGEEESTRRYYECKDFVKEKVFADFKENLPKSIITTFILNIIVSIIVKWIVDKIFNR